MAKKQTFGDKLKKGKATAKPVVKIIKGFKAESGSTKFQEEYVKLDDINDVNQIDIK